jgi:hypothetical protein
VSATVGSGESKTFAVSELGSDPDGDALTVTAAASTSSGGKVEILSGGTSLRYTAPSGYAGSDSFSFSVSDGRSSATGSASITVQSSNRSPTAGNDSATTDPHPGTVTIDVLCNDSDPDGDALSIVATSGGSYGAPSIVTGSSYCNGYAIRYEPYPGSTGVSDSFTYQVSDGRGGTVTATVTVTIR